MFKLSGKGLIKVLSAAYENTFVKSQSILQVDRLSLPPKPSNSRTNAVSTDLSEHVTEDIEAEIKKTSEISMGTEISQEDIMNIQYLCTQITTISDYRSQLYEYLKNRMNAIAPNLTILVGELVGARLIAHAGSLINLAKYPSSTVQILGAEKALFRYVLRAT